MRTILKALMFSLAAAALAAPASAASMSGGSGGKVGAVSPAMNAGGGAAPPIWVPSGGAGDNIGGAIGGPHTSSTGGGVTAPQGGPRVNFKQPGQSGKWIAGQSGGQYDWRRHHRHLPGPVYGYSYFNNGYSTEPDVNQCWVYKKVYNSRGQFIGWRHVDVCAG